MSTNYNSEKFGDYDDLNKLTEERIKEIIKYLDSKSFEYSIYYGYPIIDEDNKKDYVKGIIISHKGIVVLYENEQEKDAFISRVYNLVSQDSELFKVVRTIPLFIKEYDLSCYHQFLEYYENLENIADLNIIKKINRAIQTAYGLSRSDNREILTPDSIGERIKNRNTFIGSFDEKQFNMIHSYNDKNLRVRGLAGSGKTILLVKKMAYLHYKYPEKNIAFVFYTVSLKQNIIDLFKKYYKDYDRYKDPNPNKVDILHSWGGATRKGFYSELCNKVNFKPKTVSEANAHRKVGENSFEYVCKELCEYIDKNNVNSNFYDFIFVDEAQDFNLQFFLMARKSLTESGNLIYAYDELQSLNEDNPMPTKIEIFGETECIDINLETSYRTPVEILTTAHALGLGIYRQVNEGELPFVNMLRDKNVWSDIGYKVLEGELEYGQHVLLTRNETSLNFDGLINTFSYDEENKQYEELSKIIINLLKNEDIIPEDILIIDLSYKLANNHLKFRRIFNELAVETELFDIEKKDIPVSINLVDKNNPARMKIEKAISYTTIFRAKGNEANLVFIINADTLELMKSMSRNKIFTAMTRARYAVWLMGMSQVKLFEKEIESVKNKNYSLDFTYPTIPQLDEIKTYGESESVNEKKVRNVAKEIGALKKMNPDLAKKLLMDLLSDIEE